jgi:hypothetical protein
VSLHTAARLRLPRRRATIPPVEGPRAKLAALVFQFLSRLRFRTLFLFTATLFVVDLLVPDTIPFVDEILLGLLTVLLAQLKGPVPPTAPPPARLPGR